MYFNCSLNHSLILEIVQIDLIIIGSPNKTANVSFICIPPIPLWNYLSCNNSVMIGSRSGDMKTPVPPSDCCLQVAFSFVPDVFDNEGSNGLLSYNRWYCILAGVFVVDRFRRREGIRSINQLDSFFGSILILMFLNYYYIVVSTLLKPYYDHMYFSLL